MEKIKYLPFVVLGILGALLIYQFGIKPVGKMLEAYGEKQFQQGMKAHDDDPWMKLNRYNIEVISQALGPVNESRITLIEDSVSIIAKAFGSDIEIANKVRKINDDIFDLRHRDEKIARALEDLSRKEAEAYKNSEAGKRQARYEIENAQYEREQVKFDAEQKAFKSRMDSLDAAGLQKYNEMSAKYKAKTGKDWPYPYHAVNYKNE